MHDCSALNEDSIVLAKLVAPELPANFVKRPYLFNQFKKAFPGKVVFVSSPIGFGKTTLLAEWHHELAKQEAQYRTAWLSLDVRDEDITHFWLHLVASLAGFFPDIGKSVPLPPKSDILKEDLDQYLMRLSNFLYTQDFLGKELVLFLDNVDALPEALSVGFISFFSSYSPPGIHAVIAGSSLPSSSLSYQLLNSIYEFPAIDLAFSRQELMAFMASRYGNAASEGLVRELYEVTQGWVMGIHLFANAVEPHELRGMQALDTKLLNGLVGKYFSSCLIPQVGEDLQHFLVCTSLLEELSGPLCDYLLGISGSEHILTDLSEKAFFVRPCAKKSGWYEYHPLFLHWLRSRLFQMSIPQIRELSSKAQDWFELQGAVNMAAKYMLMASDADMIDNLAAAAHAGRDYPRQPFLAWVCEVRASDIPRDTILSMYATWGYLCSGRAEDTRRWLVAFQKNREAECLQGTGAVASELLLATELVVEHIKIKCHEFNGHYRECLDAYKKLLEDQPMISFSLRVLVLHAIAESYERLGEYSLALEYYLQTEAISDLVRSPFFVAFARFEICWILTLRGELQNAEITCQRALDDCPTDFTLYGALQSLLGFICLEKNELAEAAGHIKQSNRRVSYNRNADMYIEAQVVSACYMAAMGNLDEAYRQIVKTVLQAEQAGFPRAVLLFAYTVQAKLALQREYIDDAVSVHAKLEKLVDSADSYYVLRTRQLEAFVCQRRDEIARAHTLADGVIEGAEKASLNTIVIETLLLKAVLFNKEGRKSEAYASLNKTIILSSRLGLMRPFIDQIARLRELLHELMSIRKIDGVKYRFLKNILKSIKLYEPATSFSSGAMGAVDLTRRETEVLDLLNVGMSRQEIAEVLNVSHNTVKTHLNNIYSKLGVKNRSEVFRLMQNKDEGDSR